NQGKATLKAVLRLRPEVETFYFRSLSPHLILRTDPLSPSREIRLTLGLKDAPAGNHALSFAVVMKDKAGRVIPERLVPVGAEVMHDVAVSLPEVRFGFQKRGRPQRAEMSLASRSGKPFKVAGVECPSGLGIKPVAGGGPAQADYEMRLIAPVRPVKGEMRFKVVDGSRREYALVVPFVAEGEAR
ncbi:MAG: hypothetical protein K2W96_11965, partial [Gemmataceae bacterium]|nr:hypothetical protein [Gemmataceae bacterium]